MDITWACSQLTANIDTITSLLSHISTEQAQWKPAPEEWSMLEVINHLYDEEREDFRRRLELTLSDPNQPWPAISPQRWVTERAYQQRDFAQSLAHFQAERHQSLAWLQRLDTPPWEQVHHHPAGWAMRAGDILAAWVAHDLLHLRQLVMLRYYVTVAYVKPYQVEYAGDW